jgi:hypothetical protein
MAKPNQKIVKEKLDVWADLQAKLQKADTDKNNKLAPHLEIHNEKIKPIIDAYDAKTAAWKKQSADLQAEIIAMCENDRDAEGNPKPVLIAAEKAMVAVEKKEGSRVLDPQKYFEFIKDKNAAFWESVNVVLKHADKILGKTKAEELSDKPAKYVSSVKLK